MATKKKDNNKENKWNLGEIAQRRHVDGALYRSRSSALSRTAALMSKLIAQQPAVKDQRLTEALGLLKEAEVMARAAHHKVMAVTTIPVADARNHMLVALTGVTHVLETHARSPLAELAAQAEEVLVEAFGANRAEVYRMGVHDAWYAVDLMRERIVTTPGLRDRMEELVHPSAVALLLDAHAKLGRLAGFDGPTGKMTGVDVRGLVEHANTCIDHYVSCVLASATPGDQKAVARAEAALGALIELRDELAARARRGRSGSEAEDEEVEDVPPVVTAPGTAVAPVAPTVRREEDDPASG